LSKSGRHGARRATREATVFGKKLVIAIVVVLAVAASAVALAAGTNGTDGTDGTDPGWQKALEIRSDALNRQYRLGAYAQQRTTADATPEWAKALEIRSDALNRQYRLGKYAGK